MRDRDYLTYCNKGNTIRNQLDSRDSCTHSTCNPFSLETYIILEDKRSIIGIFLSVGIFSAQISGNGASASQMSVNMFSTATIYCRIAAFGHAEAPRPMCCHAGGGHWKAIRSTQIKPQSPAIGRGILLLHNDRLPLCDSVRQLRATLESFAAHIATTLSSCAA